MDGFRSVFSQLLQLFSRIEFQQAVRETKTTNLKFDFMLKVLSVFGTRPEAIKMAPVVRELVRRSDRFVSKVCVTAQHRRMLDQVLELFQIVPEYDLNIMQDNQTPTQVASAVLSRLEPILQAERPDWMLIQGDTTTVLGASLTAFYARTRVGHVEAGLRTHDKWQPFPEEINRRVAGVIADLHLAPTEGARQNLLREGVPSGRVLVTGNSVIDALDWVSSLPLSSEAQETLSRYHIYPLLRGLNGARLILVTAHRRENFGQPLENICMALRDIAERYKAHVHLVYPVHPNPNVRGPVYRLLRNVSNITLTPPLDYLPFVHLMKHSYMVLTDSGGIQEEAPELGVPVLVLREVTERPEAVEAGTVRVVGTNRGDIVAEIVGLMENDEVYNRMAHAVNPYGDGRAAERIVGALLGEKVFPFKPISTS